MGLGSGHGYDERIEEVRRTVRFDLLFKELFNELWKPKGLSYCPFHSNTDTPAFQLNKDFGYCHGNCDDTRRSRDVFDLYRLARGCSFNEALDALSGRAKRAPGTTDDNPVIHYYKYRNADGTPAFEVGRRKNKLPFHCRHQTPKGYVNNHKGVKIVLYELPRIVENPDATVFLVEGEKDADRLNYLFDENKANCTATTAPNGAASWKKHCEDHKIHEALRDRKVVLLPDNDEPGTKWAGEVTEWLLPIATEVRRLELPGLTEKQDVSDYMDKHGDIRGYQKFMGLYDQLVKEPYKLPDPSGLVIFTHGDLRKNPPPPPEWIIEGIMPEGMVGVFGAPKVGKTFMWQDMVYSVASGDLVFGEFACGASRCLIFPLEDGKSRLWERGSQMVGSDEFWWEDNVQFVQGSWLPLSGKGTDGLEDQIRRWVTNPAATIPPAMVVIDTLQKARPNRKGNRNAYALDYDDLGALGPLALELHIAIVVISHLRKDKKGADEFDAISGSTGMAGTTDTVWIVNRPQRKELTASLSVTPRDAEPQTYTLEFDPAIARWKCLGKADEVKEGRLKDRIWAAAAQLGRPFKIADIVQMIAGKETSVRAEVSRMYKAGLLAKRMDNLWSLREEGI